MPEIHKLIDNKARSTDSKTQAPQTVARTEVAGRTFDVFSRKREMRDQRHKLFRDRTLQHWLDDNIKRFVQFKRRPAYKKPWQSNLASSTPNEKLIGILSKIATQGMEAKVLSQKEVSFEEIFVKERVGNALLKSAAIKNNDDFQIVLEMLEASEKGIVIGFEDWFFKKTKIREIKNQNPETGELEFEEKVIDKWNDVRSQIIDVEDFYPGNIHVRPGMIQDMDDCFMRTVMNEDEFDAEFAKYPDAKKVTTVTSASQNESTVFWKQSDDIGNDQIEVLRYFNKKTDEYIIIANGIWINYIGKDTIQPLPWNHKQLPFWASVFEPLDANFFYGRSLIDKLISFTDGKDAFFDRMMDQATLAVARPVVTDGKAASALTKGFLQPDNVIETDWTEGRPNFEVVPIPDISNSSVTMYQLLQQNLESATVSSEGLGGEGQRKKTATEASIQAEGAIQLVSLFLKMMEQGIKGKNALRFANQLQFYTMPINSDKEGERFKRVILRDQELGTGKRGTMQIEFTTEANQQRVESKDQELLEDTEFIEITPSFIRDFQFEIAIVPQSSVKMTEAQRQILELNYQRVVNELYPDKFNRDEGFDELARVFNKDPQKSKKQEGQAEEEQGEVAELGGGNPLETGVPGEQGQNPVKQMTALNSLATL